VKIVHFETLDSTQDKAKEFLSSGVELPFAIYADMQTKGRGRSGNEWVSQSGNLFTSIVIPLKNIDAKDAGQYSFLTAVALMDTLSDYGVSNAVNKWPNDILVDGKKIAGILLESDIGADGLINALIIGIGVNLVSAPEGAISLRHCERSEAIQKFDRKNWIATSALPHHNDSESFLSHFIINLDKNLDIIKQNGFIPIREKWLTKAHGLGSIIRVRLPHETFHGEFIGLEEEGALLVNVDGKPRKVYSGEVFFG
jgi:BirA family biotin operon repressor/biotin-[acetyl-CoA-carboxylase] ligase